MATVSNPYTFTITENVVVNIDEPNTSSSAIPSASDILLKISYYQELAGKIKIPTGITKLAFKTKTYSGTVSSTIKYIKVTSGKTYWFKNNMDNQQTYTVSASNTYPTEMRDYQRDGYGHSTTDLSTWTGKTNIVRFDYFSTEAKANAALSNYSSMPYENNTNQSMNPSVLHAGDLWSIGYPVQAQFSSSPAAPVRQMDYYNVGDTINLDISSNSQQTYFEVYIVEFDNISNKTRVVQLPGPNLGNTDPPDYMVIDYSPTINNETPDFTIA